MLLLENLYGTQESVFLNHVHFKLKIVVACYPRRINCCYKYYFATSHNILRSFAENNHGMFSKMKYNLWNPDRTILMKEEGQAHTGFTESSLRNEKPKWPMLENFVRLLVVMTSMHGNTEYFNQLCLDQHNGQ